MINLFLWFITVIILFVQLLFPPFLRLGPVKPDLLVAVIVFLSLYSKNRRVLFWAVVLGGIRDFVTATPFGMNILIYSSLSLLLITFPGRFFLRQNLQALFIFSFVVSFTQALLEALVRNFLLPAELGLATWFKVLGMQSVLTGIYTFLLVILIKKCVIKFSLSQLP